MLTKNKFRPFDLENGMRRTTRCEEWGFARFLSATPTDVPMIYRTLVSNDGTAQSDFSTNSPFSFLLFFLNVYFLYSPSRIAPNRRVKRSLQHGYGKFVTVLCLVATVRVRQAHKHDFRPAKNQIRKLRAVYSRNVFKF